MRILFFGNNWLAWKVIEWLRGQNEQIVGLVLHPNGKRKFGEEIIRCAGINDSCIFDGSQLRQPEVIQSIQHFRPDIGLSILFGYIVKKEVLDLLPQGCINLHPALLPYNRGAYPNVWSIVEQTRAGTTIHYMDEGVDTGDIIAQREVEVEPIDTGESLYRKLETASLELFIETWPRILSGKAPRQAQLKDEGTYHRAADVEKVDEINLDQSYTARELINILRARTFESYRGAYFIQENRRVYLQLKLEYETSE